MLIAFRRRLGSIKDKLERRMEKLAGGGPRELAPISLAERDVMIEWITGKLTDGEFIDQAKSGAVGRSLIERACAARPANALVWAARAAYCLEDGDLAEAVDHAERAFVLGRLEPQVGLVLVRVLIAAKRREDALKIIQAALGNARRLRSHAARFELCSLWQGLEPESIEPLLEAARAQVGAGNLDTAIAEFQALLGRFGQRADILLPLAAVYQDQVRIDEAMRTYLGAVDADPGNVDALCMAGLCARDLGDMATADRLLGRAFEVDPSSSFAQYNLGLLRLDQGRIDESAALILGARNANRGEPWTAGNLEAMLAAPVQRDVADVEWANARFKLLHDMLQLWHLRSKGLLPTAIDAVILEHRVALSDPLLPSETFRMVALDPAKYPLLARTYKAPVYAPDPEPPQGPVVNPDLAWKDIEQQYLEGKPGLVVIDDLLTSEALSSLRAYCLESTFWNELKGGYLGAYMPDGFSGRLLLRIASELRPRLPGLLKDHPLRTMWGYKYDPGYPGIGLHADAAGVNVNFWLTPDEANLDPESGGLVIYTQAAPRDGGIDRYTPDGNEIRRHLDSAGAKSVKVPYRANRAVLFDSALFHESDTFRFRDEYENRRVSVTLAYGAPAV